MISIRSSFFREPLNKSMHAGAPGFGMRCKAQSTAIPGGIVSICNKADRPKPGCIGREGFIQSFLSNLSSVFRKSVLVFPLLLSNFIFSPVSVAADICANLSSPIYQVVNPKSQANLLTPWLNEAILASKQYGFTQGGNVPFYASLTAAPGLIAAHRLYNVSSNDFIWSTNLNEIASAVQKYHYVDQGVNFYVSPSSGSCAQPVYRFLKKNMHRFAVSQADRDALAVSGWQSEGVQFYARVNDPNSVFTIAIMPDTETEMQTDKTTNCPPPTGSHHTEDKRFAQRTEWLADHKDALNLRYVLHVGDVVNRGERDEWQYQQIADPGMQTLEKAGIPYVLAVGNNDTLAVAGGDDSACGRLTTEVRKSPLFNKYFSNRFGDPAGSYEAYCAKGDVNPQCNISNGYTVFNAGGLKWLVLSLELWPRKEVVAWAEGIVKDHPNYNVIVVTHSYLSDEDEDKSKGKLNPGPGYGETDPEYLKNHLITNYPNIRFIFSGHDGTAASYQYPINSAVAYLQAFDSKPISSTNPVRILQIDTANNTATSYIYSPWKNQYWNGGINWITATPADVQKVKSNMNYIR